MASGTSDFIHSRFGAEQFPTLEAGNAELSE
jgi:hypothetical protein